jgi:prephenate dehydratase
MGSIVAYPGREGAHSAAACERLFPDAAEVVSMPSFIAVADAAAEGAVEFGVLPIESSLSGPVAETHDILHDSALSITDETILRIRHCLVGPELVPLEQIKTIRSHPAALDQCRQLLAAMPWATAIASATTADAAAEVEADGDPSEAAIASERAATAHSLTVIAGDVGDHPEAYTRFVALAPYTRLDRAGEAWRTAFYFVTDHRPGALHRAIEPFGRHDLDLVQLVSRPLPATPWRYRFDDRTVQTTVAELRSATRDFVVFGSYPAHS